MAAVKCQQCTLMVDKTQAVFIGEKVKKYFHQECLPVFQEKEEAKKRDIEYRDKLYLLLEQIYETKIDNGIYILLATFRKQLNSDWETLYIAYDHCKDLIINAKPTKPFDSFKGKFAYGIAIVKDKIGIVKRQIYKQERAQAFAEIAEAKQVEQIEHAEREYHYKPKGKTSYDISDFLD